MQAVTLTQALHSNTTYSHENNLTFFEFFVRCVVAVVEAGEPCVVHHSLQDEGAKHLSCGGGGSTMAGPTACGNGFPKHSLLGERERLRKGGKGVSVKLKSHAVSFFQ